ncbi:MAG: hypothetical protein V4623_09530, partial [Pseudomonadota bacterium]
ASPAFPNATQGFTTQQRFLLVPASGPVTFACSNLGLSNGNGSGVLRRYTNYGFNSTQNPLPNVADGAANSLLADNISACQFSYSAANNGLLSLILTLTQSGESLTLTHQIHVDNTP